MCEPVGHRYSAKDFASHIAERRRAASGALGRLPKDLPLDAIIDAKGAKLDGANGRSGRRRKRTQRYEYPSCPTAEALTRQLEVMQDMQEATKRDMDKMREEQEAAIQAYNDEQAASKARYEEETERLQQKLVREWEAKLADGSSATAAAATALGRHCGGFLHRSLFNVRSRRTRGACCSIATTCHRLAGVCVWAFGRNQCRLVHVRSPSVEDRHVDAGEGAALHRVIPLIVGPGLLVGCSPMPT